MKKKIKKGKIYTTLKDLAAIIIDIFEK